jgi:dUTP pyrophosphatase
MKVKIVNKSGFHLPFYATELSAGMDLKASIETPIELDTLERAVVPTGIYIELTAGYEV